VKTRRTLLLGSLLGVVLVVAASMAGTPRFPGPRWLPSGSPGETQPEHLDRPALPPLPRQRQRPPDASGADDLVKVILWIVLGLCLLLVLVWLVPHVRRWLAGRELRRTSLLDGAEELHDEGAPVPQPEPEPDLPVMQRGIERALARLGQEHEPHDAVLRAWLGLEETAVESGIVRSPAETPTEFTARILRRVFADDRAIKTLLELYLRVRFGERPVTEPDVVRARAALESLVETWAAAPEHA
jgi:hypothetical protein